MELYPTNLSEVNGDTLDQVLKCESLQSGELCLDSKVIMQIRKFTDST